jgi:hypothetical protein
LVLNSSPDPAARTRRLNVLLAVAVGALALAVRVWGLEAQSFTMDEVADLDFVRQSVSRIIPAQDGFPPLYQLILKGWLAVMGPESARWFSVLCGLLLIPVVWHLARMVGGTTTAWAAAFLVAVSPLHVWYSQEARANVLFHLVAVSCVWLFVRAVRSDRIADWSWYALSAVVGLYIHYFFTLVVAGLLAATLLFPSIRSRLGSVVRIHLVIALAAIPWLWLLLPDLRLQSGYIAPHVSLDLKALGYTLVTFLFGFSVGPSLRDLHVSQSGDMLLRALPWGLVAVAICALLARPLWRDPGSRRWALQLGLIMVVPIAACGVAAATLDLGFRVRYVAWGATLLLVLLSAAMVRGWGDPAAKVAAALLVGLSLVSLVNRHWSERYHNEDARSAASYLATRVPDSGFVFVTSGYMTGTVDHYLSDGPRLQGLPNLPPDGPPSKGLDAIRKNVREGARFWLLYSRPWDGDPGGRLREELRRLAGLRLVMAWPGMELYEGRGW